jgi:biotin carboxyl carrier protein
VTFDVEVGGRLRRITVTRVAERLRVDADGRHFVVDARRLDGRALSLLVGRDQEGLATRSVDAVVTPGHAPFAYDVSLAGRSTPVTIRPAGASARHNRHAGAAHAAGPQRVVAPMPGRIVRVLVKSGDDVAPRQGLVVIEAMKMENELRASRQGRVRDVLVSEGQLVDAGTSLIVVE